MNSFLSVTVTIICVILFCSLYWLWINPRHRTREKPPVNNPTMFDVRRLLKEGDKKAAIRSYARIFKVSSSQARKDIDELERSMKV
jgi:hypothetical protein